jgi:hypothetical protein
MRQVPIYRDVTVPDPLQTDSIQWLAGELRPPEQSSFRSVPQNRTDSAVNAWSFSPSASGDYGWQSIVHFPSGATGFFFNCEPLICADDAEAIVLASRLVGIRDVELWSGDRLVIRLTRTTD